MSKLGLLCKQISLGKNSGYTHEHVSHKSAKIALLIASCQGQALPAHYLGYFECFNRQMFYEAHDVLEELWLAVRGTADDGFYKGLIQLAGAFVHLQKNRLGPAAALFRLSRSYLQHYPARHHQLSLPELLGLIDRWLQWLEEDPENPLRDGRAPHLALVPNGGGGGVLG